MVSFSACSLAQGSEAKKVQSHSTGQSQAQILGPTICEDKRKDKAESGTKPLREKTNSKRALFKIMRIVVRFVALRVRVLCQEMYHRSTSQNISWDLQPLQHQKSTLTHWWQCLTSRRAHVHDLLVKSLVTICRRWCSSPTNKWMTSLASAAIRNKTLLHNLAWMQHSN